VRRSTAAVGSAVFFLAAPGTVAGVLPWLITGWRFQEPPGWQVTRVIGVLLICAGLIPTVRAFVEFARAGGTPMPTTPTEHLVVTGANRYIRNPMYAGLLLVIVGQAFLFGQYAGPLVYAAVVWAVTAAFVRWYEEPTLRRTYGAEYEAYRRAVPAWWPRLRPWTPEQGR